MTHALHQSGIIDGIPGGIDAAMRAQDKLVGKDLRRLAEPERGPVQRLNHYPFRAGALDCIFGRDGGDGSAVLAHSSQSSLDERRGDKWARPVVNQDIIRRGRERLQPDQDGITPPRAAGRHGANGTPAMVLVQELAIIERVFCQHHDEIIDQPGFLEDADAVRQQRLVAKHGPGFVDALHALTAARGNNDGSHSFAPALAAHPALLPLGYFLAALPFGCAKIMRPATVCSTRVTVTSTVLFMCWRPPSTTIIVPSSR